MKFNGVNNKERQRYPVVSGVVICACVGIPCAPRLRRIGVCFERELPALFCVAAHHPSSFSSHGRKLCYFASVFSGILSLSFRCLSFRGVRQITAPPPCWNRRDHLLQFHPLRILLLLRQNPWLLQPMRPPLFLLCYQLRISLKLLLEL